LFAYSPSEVSGTQTFEVLLSYLVNCVESFPDKRTGKNTQFSLEQISRAAFGVFFCQSPSFLAYQQLMQQQQGKNNASSLFGVREIPSDNHIRAMLDPVEPSLLNPVYQNCFQLMQRQGLVQPMRFLANSLLIALDATGYFLSESIHCPSCMVSKHHDGRVSYTHAVVLPAVVSPQQSHVVPLQPEFLSQQDGHDRQDCELRAALRWIEGHAQQFSPLGVTLLGDDLYSHTPIIQEAVKQEMHFLFVAKPVTHKHLFEEIEGIEKLGGVGSVQRSGWTGRAHRCYHYRWLNDVSLTADKNSPVVSWVELQILDEKQKVTYHNCWVTSYSITEENVVDVVRAARCRWKIENQNFNTLKTKGYHFEHNFGHGQQYLSQTLLSLNVIAFLFHTILELMDSRCALLRCTLPRRDTFFQHVATLTQYLCFDSWVALMQFMLKGLHLSDPDG
jgi:hypothetical protein